MAEDIGVLVRDVEPVTLKLTLRTEHRTKANVLQLYTERHSHALLVSNVEVEPGKPIEVEFYREKGAGRLLVRWFVDDVDEDGLVAQEAIASGFYRRPLVELLDIEGQSHGSVTVLGWTGTDYETPKLHQPLQWIKQVDEAHKSLKAKYDDTFSDVNVFVDRVRAMPLIWYSLSATEIVAQPGPTTILLDHWLALAVRFAHPTQTDDESILADLLSILSLGWVYRPDQVYKGAESDHWSSLLSFPSPHRAAFDCEDGTKALYEVCLVLQNLTLTSSASKDLLRLQTLARQYTFYLAVVELKSSSGKMTGNASTYLPHCCGVMLSPGRVPITIESTAYASGAWVPDLMQRRPTDHEVHAKQASAAGTGAAVRSRIPLSMVHGQRMYGRLLSLWTSSSEGRTRHLLLKTGKSHGMDANTFFLKDKGVLSSDNHLVALDLSHKEAMEGMGPLLALTPRSVFPLPPPQLGVPVPKFKNDIDILECRHRSKRGLAITDAMVLNHTVVTV